MALLGKARRSQVIAEAQKLLIKGLYPARVSARLQERFGVCPATARKLVKRAYQHWSASLRRYGATEQVAAMAAQMDHAAWLAQRTKKVIATKDGVITVATPDVRAMVLALQAKAELLGINAPKRTEIEFSGYGEWIAKHLLQILIEDVADLPLRTRLLKRVQTMFEQGMPPLPKKREVVIEIPVQEVTRQLVQGTLPPPSHNGNGHA